jgi:hypothetical protein
MAIHNLKLRRDSSVKFFKLLGTGKGETFTPRDADPFRWGLLVVYKKSDQPDGLTPTLREVIHLWSKISESTFRAELLPISVHGSWSGINPFDALGTYQDAHGQMWEGETIAITRARIKWRWNLRFWAAVPPVVNDLSDSSGLITSLGIGEAPIGLQGTFSLWKSPQALREFAYNGQAHKAVIEATQRNRWYAEEMFGRFALISRAGDLR